MLRMIRALLFSVLLAGASYTTCAAAKTNVLYLLVDDLGWTDLACYGSDLHETPNIDALAASGARFKAAYSACTVCSPSRAAVMTGKYPARLHCTDFIPGHRVTNMPMRMPDWTARLKHSETTIAEVLKKEGYATAHIGKWHLTRTGPPGDAGAARHPEDYPDKHGFDVNIAGHERGLPPSYFWPYGRGKTLAEKKNNPLFETLAPGGEDGREGEYLTDRLTDEAIAIMKRWQDKPFFLYLPYYTVHTPIQAKPELVAKYKAKLEKRGDGWHFNPAYAAMVQNLDESVGRLVAAIDELGLSDRTAIVLTSDNGGLTGPPSGTRHRVTTNLPLRQGKGSIYEGGVRVPAIVRWPGITHPGIIHLDPIITMDFFPTILELTGAKTIPENDGVSFAALLRDSHNRLPKRSLFWHYPHYHSCGAVPYSAIRHGDWKLIDFHNPERPPELYNLVSDLHEDRNRFEDRPEIGNLLRERLLAWQNEVGAQRAEPNPDYDADKPSGGARSGKVSPLTATRWELEE